ncbi:hypothetical protein DFH11DRAFT_1556813 [Phellopilus nigrolimitatus]|nr:hypothetical protein DFH11DRAFT_1556813 [Phellopilus nigrolimitatus]
MRYSSYFDLASMTILTYDYLITFNAEKRLIWPSPWSLPKVLFLLTRYLPFIDTSIVLWHQFNPFMTQRDCTLAYMSTGWMILLGILVAEIILLLRTWAVWERGRNVGIGLSIWTAALWIPNMVCMGIFLKSLKFAPLPLGLPGCLVVSGSTVLSINWILLMIFEAGILGLMVIKAVQKYRIQRSTIIYKAVYRDGSIFYVYLFAFSLANVIVILTLPHDFLNLLSSIERVTHSILTARILLNLRSLLSSKGGDTFSSGESMELVSVSFPGHRDT